MLRFYLDEDVPHSLMHALHARGVDVVSTAAVERRGRSDVDQLRYATAEGRVIVTCNVGDFAALHREALTAGRRHAGIIAVSEQRFPAGEYATALDRIARHFTADEMTDRMEYLGAWL